VVGEQRLQGMISKTQGAAPHSGCCGVALALLLLLSLLL
jgi:hypothetical protein